MVRDSMQFSCVVHLSITLLNMLLNMFGKLFVQDKLIVSGAIKTALILNNVLVSDVVVEVAFCFS